jgi:hypothetical protein
MFLGTSRGRLCGFALSVTGLSLESPLWMLAGATSAVLHEVIPALLGGHRLRWHFISATMHDG